MPHQDDVWNPNQYEKFRAEREAPGLDLIAGIESGVFPRGIDLGCGTGELTAQVQTALNIADMHGIDNSESMLVKARSLETPALHFDRQPIESFNAVAEYDLVFSNAALNWCEDHSQILSNIVNSLRISGQLAIQMPANHEYPTHRIADELGRTEPFLSALQREIRPTNVRSPAWYETTLNRLGISQHRVELKTYTHTLESREHVIEWVKGTLLTWYECRLSSEMFGRFIAEYRRRLFAELPDDSPFQYPFKRLFIWGRK